MERESMEFDVVIVGAGPAGLTAAIRLKQLEAEQGREVSVCVLEKGSEVGAHILSGAVLEPRSLNELIPDWADKGAPLNTPAKRDSFVLLTERRSFRFPVTPPQMRNDGNYIISLGNLCRWLGEQAEALGVEIYPGFPAAEVIYGDRGEVCGVVTGDLGVGRDGKPTDHHQPGMELRAKQTLFAEGCRGSLTKTLFDKFGLREGVDPQTFGIGLKELWEIDPAKHRQGDITHTIGWPLDSRTYGGSFLYHLEHNQVAVGFVVGLDYENPYFDPFLEFQRFKTHPTIRPLFEGGRRISYGARALNEGGFQSIPKLTFPGGALIGCTAGFMNVPKIKGTHTAMKSAMLAAESVYEMLTEDGTGAEATAYPERLRDSWVWSELRAVRNIRPAFRNGLLYGLANAALEAYVFRGKTPWTRFTRRVELADNETCARFSFHLNKAAGSVRLKDLGVSYAGPSLGTVASIRFASEAVGNLFVPGEALRFRVSLHAKAPRKAAGRRVRCVASPSRSNCVNRPSNRASSASSARHVGSPPDLKSISSWNSSSPFSWTVPQRRARSASGSR